MLERIGVGVSPGARHRHRRRSPAGDAGRGRGRSAYDRLVIALGSRLEPAGAARHRARLRRRQLRRRLALDRHLQTLPLGATVTVVGSGFTGVELATELAARFRVVLLERADGPGAEPGRRPARDDRAAPSTRSASRSGSASTLRAHRRRHRPCGAAAWPRIPCTRTLPAERDRAGPPHHRAEPGRTRAAPASTPPATWRTPWPTTTHVALMSCQHAIKLGQFAGHNAAERPARPSDAAVSPAHLSHVPGSGDAGAVQTEGWERRVLIAGAEVKTIKRQINPVWAALPPSRSTASASWLSASRAPASIATAARDARRASMERGGLRSRLHRSPKILSSTRVTLSG